MSKIPRIGTRGSRDTPQHTLSSSSARFLSLVLFPPFRPTRFLSSHNPSRGESWSSDPTQQPTRPPHFQSTPSASYFNFTKSKTKIAHTPTVIGNYTSTASRIGVPLGSTKVRPNIANAVTIPSANLVVEFIVVLPRQSCDEHHPRKIGEVQLLMSVANPSAVGFIRREVLSQMGLGHKIPNRLVDHYIESLSAKFGSQAVESWFRQPALPLLTTSDSSQQKIKYK